MARTSKSALGLNETYFRYLAVLETINCSDRLESTSKELLGLSHCIVGILA